MFLRPTRQALLEQVKTLILPAEASLLLAHVQNESRENIIAHPEKPVSPFQTWKFLLLCRQRHLGMPIAYLSGHKEFFGLDFLVNKHTLVPRPETETLAEAVAENAMTYNLTSTTQIVMIDVGTGSGCIPIAIIKTLWQKKIKLPLVIASDISRKALLIAKKNAKRHNVDITFIRGNLLEPAIKKLTKKFKILNLKSEIIITANLPYLTAEQFDREPSIQHEPRSALVAERDGLALYEELLIQIKNHRLCLIGCTLYLEIDPSQAEKIITIIKKISPAATVNLIKDLSGQNRVVKLKISSPDPM